MGSSNSFSKWLGLGGSASVNASAGPPPTDDTAFDFAAASFFFARAIIACTSALLFRSLGFLGFLADLPTALAEVPIPSLPPSTASAVAGRLRATALLGLSASAFAGRWRVTALFGLSTGECAAVLVAGLLGVPAVGTVTDAGRCRATALFGRLGLPAG